MPSGFLYCYRLSHMDVYISPDMEGITGIADPRDVAKGEADYEIGKELMVGDVNAAIDGALETGADRVLVNDSHSTMTNLARTELDERAELVRGSTKPWAMMQGIDERDYTVAFFVGYHAKAGTEAAVLNHSFFAQEIVRFYVNDTEVGELGVNAGVAADYGIPVGLVTGDDKTGFEAEDVLGDVEPAVVKWGTDRFGTRSLPLEEAHDRIRTAARTAVERAANNEFDQPEFDTPVSLKAEWETTNMAYSAAQFPTVERVEPRTTEVVADSYVEAFDQSVAMIRAGYSGKNEWFG